MSLDELQGYFAKSIGLLLFAFLSWINAGRDHFAKPSRLLPCGGERNISGGPKTDLNFPAIPRELKTPLSGNRRDPKIEASSF